MGFAAINAEAAFARGITGKGIHVGVSLIAARSCWAIPEFTVDKNIMVLSLQPALRPTEQAVRHSRR